MDKKQCDTCFQILPITHFYVDIESPLGRRDRCQDCMKFNARSNKDGIDRRLRNHNKTIVTIALSKMDFESVGYDIHHKRDIKWKLRLSKYDTVFESGGILIEYPPEIPLKLRIDYFSKKITDLGLRLELSPFDREMAKRTIYIY